MTKVLYSGYFEKVDIFKKAEAKDTGLKSTLTIIR